MMTPHASQHGFTFIEILVVIAILGIIVSFSAQAFMSMGKNAAFISSTDTLYRAFLNARNNTLASNGRTTYGVFVNATSVTVFPGSMYSSGNPGNSVTMFDGDFMATGSLVTNAMPVIFAQLSGMPSATGTITLFSKSDPETSSMTIRESGLIERN